MRKRHGCGKDDASLGSGLLSQASSASCKVA